MWPHQRKSVNGKELDKKDPAVPCGLVAKSVFNDTFVLKNDGGKEIKIEEKGIAWKSDLEFKFANVN